MSRKTIVRFIFVLALLMAAGLLARATSAKADTARDTVAAPKSPSVVMNAFRQGQVIGSGQYRAALVVQYADGGLQKRCVAFDEAQIGGDELLTMSGLDFSMDPTGAICAISGQGCSADDCFCECPFPNCEYWAYYHWDGGSWIYSNTGPAEYAVSDGALEGWSWGEGDFNQGVEPPVIPFDQICPTALSQATPTVTSPSGSGAPTISFFTAQPTTIQPGSCSTLSWQVVNGATVLLEGARVNAEGTQQVCPANTQTYTLIAANASGQQTSQQVTVNVSASSGAAQATATPAATVAAVVAGAPTSPVVYPTPDVIRSGMPTPAYINQPQPVVTQAPQPITQSGAVGGFPSPDPNLSPLAGQQLVGGVPLAPTAEPAAMDSFPQAPQGPLPTATRFALARPATETPRPRRILGDGRPTPTPILVARAGGAPGSGAATTQDRSSAAAASNANSALVASRAFNDNLLPQYAAYLATLTVLLAMGWLVHRRRGGQPSAVTQRVRDGERLASRDERAAQ